jgi:DHA3 family macrolide efflux protein-like MFS transporter
VLWASQAASLFGSQVVLFALVWYLTKETGSATILSTAVMVALIPQIALGPFIGPFIDRWNRKKIMIYSDLITMLLTLVLVVLFYTNSIQIWHIYLVLMGRAISGTFQGPAMQASIATIVPEQHLTRAHGLNTTLQGILAIVAPPAGAFLMEALPMQWVLSVDIFTAIIAIGILMTLAIPQPARTTLTGKINIIGDMMQGFRYILKRRALTILLGMAALLNFFFAPAMYMMPMLVKEHLGADVLKLGWLGTAEGIGLIVGGALLGVWGGFKKRIHTSVLGILLMGISAFSLGFINESLFYFALICALILAFGSALTNSPILAILNVIIDRDMQGRVFTLIGSITALMTPLGLAIGGPLADAIGIRWLFIIAGIAETAVVPIVFFNKALMNLENEKPIEGPVPEGPRPST